MARGKGALQSLPSGTSSADLAVDGNVMTCSLWNANDDHPWFMVDLGDHYQIVDVIIVTGTDSGKY